MATRLMFWMVFLLDCLQNHTSSGSSTALLVDNFCRHSNFIHSFDTGSIWRSSCIIFIFIWYSWRRVLELKWISILSSSSIMKCYEISDWESCLMTYGLKLSLEAWILKFKKKSFNNLRFNELQLHFGNSNFFCKA